VERNLATALRSRTRINEFPNFNDPVFASRFVFARLIGLKAEDSDIDRTAITPDFARLYPFLSPLVSSQKKSESRRAGRTKCGR